MRMAQNNSLYGFSGPDVWLIAQNHDRLSAGFAVGFYHHEAGYCNAAAFSLSGWTQEVTPQFQI